MQSSIDLSLFQKNQSYPIGAISVPLKFPAKMQRLNDLMPQEILDRLTPGQYDAYSDDEEASIAFNALFKMLAEKLK